MKPVDAHCHLYFDQFGEDREKVLERAREKLEFVGVPGVNPETNRKVMKLQKKHGNFVKCNLGLHPVYTDSFKDLDTVKDQIREKDPAAVGEIGLDHHHVTDEEEREKQEQVFRELLELAEELDKPVVIHSREAERKAVEITEEYDIGEVFMHCFNGSVELAEKAADSGMKIGVTTQVLYSSRVQDIVRELDIDNIVLETDSPYLYRGERNEPVNVLESVKKIADLKNMEKKEVVSTTTRNAIQIYDRQE